ncbi:replication initiation protein [Sulfurimonas hydrogeniphila]|uniref:replication initiation protein n=1 Tax=Sulfurimonas hydrogeniphila TaxID=2509341 RepID=UPI00125ED2DE|nr:replication initiation protein [Sulfurimonas hydrogeniphila]
MYDFLEQNELDKIINRFNKMRLYHKHGYNNLLPISTFKKYAKNYQQVQLNTNFHFNAIIMDIDDETLLTEWNAQGLPVPTIQTVNKNNNRAHLVWLLNTPVYKEYKHAVAYYMAIVNSIKKLIGADLAYQNHQTKNFLNTELFRVTYNDVAYDLEDFRKFIAHDVLAEHQYAEFDYLVAESRHIHLFELLRGYGYTIAKDPDLLNKLTQKAEAINQGFNNPIKVKYIVKSVYQFCEQNRNNFKDKNRKRVMNNKKIYNLPPREYKEEVKRRQSRSAIRTSTIKKLKTATKIKIAIDQLIRKKLKLTIQNIANYANISSSTVRRNIKIVQIFIQKSTGFIRSIRLIVRRASQGHLDPKDAYLWVNSFVPFQLE